MWIITAHCTRSHCEGWWKVLHIQCIGWDWCWYVMEWQWKGQEC